MPITKAKYKKLLDKEKQELLRNIYPAIDLNLSNGGHYRRSDNFPISIEEVVKLLNQAESSRATPPCD